MKGRPKVAVLLLLAASLAILIVAGCSSSQQQSSSTTKSNQGQTNAPKTMKIGIVEQWAASAHSVPITFAAKEKGCKNCHDGLTFMTTGGGFVPRVSSGTSGSADVSGSLTPTGTASTRDWVVATDCRACHTGEGAKIADAGSVSGVPSLPSAKGGLGAVCMACHNGWHGAGPQPGGSAMPAPHGSVQTDVLYGINTLSLETSNAGATTSSTASGQQSPHLKLTNTCADCHMAMQSNAPNHTMLIDNWKGCQKSGCHKSDMTDGGKALKDYDGNGTIENVQVEFEGLMTQLKTAINKKAGSTDFMSQAGQVVFKGATVSAKDPAYKAAYNYFYALNDKSKGIHNAPFTFKLLQDSLAAVK